MAIKMLLIILMRGLFNSEYAYGASGCQGYSIPRREYFKIPAFNSNCVSHIDCNFVCPILNITWEPPTNPSHLSHFDISVKDYTSSDIVHHVSNMETRTTYYNGYKRGTMYIVTIARFQTSDDKNYRDFKSTKECLSPSNRCIGTTVQATSKLQVAQFSTHAPSVRTRTHLTNLGVKTSAHLPFSTVMEHTKDLQTHFTTPSNTMTRGPAPTTFSVFKSNKELPTGSPEMKNITGNTWLIAAIGTASLLILSLVIVCAVILWKRSKTKQSPDTSDDSPGQYGNKSETIRAGGNPDDIYNHLSRPTTSTSLQQNNHEDTYDHTTSYHVTRISQNHEKYRHSPKSDNLTHPNDAIDPVYHRAGVDRIIDPVYDKAGVDRSIDPVYDRAGVDRSVDPVYDRAGVDRNVDPVYDRTGIDRSVDPVYDRAGVDRNVDPVYNRTGVDRSVDPVYDRAGVDRNVDPVYDRTGVDITFDAE